MNKHHLKATTHCCLLTAIIFTTSAASTLAPLPSIVDYTEGDGWGSGVGIQLESAASFRGSDHNMVEFKLEGAVQWRHRNQVLFWEGYDLNQTEIGWRGLLQDKWLIEGGARHEIVIPTSRSEKAGVDNLPHRGSHILGFVEAKHTISQDWMNWVSGRFIFGSSDYGWQSKIAAGHRLSREYRNYGAELVAYSTFSSNENKNNYFGLSAEDEAATDLQAIDFDGGYRSSGVNLVYRRFVNRRIQFTAKAGVEVYASDIEKSSLVSDATETNAEMSLVWH